MTLLIGADPEFFISRKGRFISAHGIIPGTKKDPFPVHKGAVQVDGHALEFNIEPAVDADAFIKNIRTVLYYLRAMVPQSIDFRVVAVADFDSMIIESSPKEANVLGCDPDYDVYSGRANPRPDQHPTKRTAAGHVHLGYTANRDVHDPVHLSSCDIVIRQMDFWIGLMSIILDPDFERKQMYGKAGAYRPKSYGCEYRTPSNFWIKNQDLMRLVFNNAHKGFTQLSEEGIFLGDKYGDICQEIINTNNKLEAEKLCKEIGIPYQV